MKKIISTIVLSLIISILSFSKGKGYDIIIQIKGVQDSVCYLAYYDAENTFLQDTAYLEGNGKYRFRADSLIKQGMYIVAGENNNKYFDFLIDNDQQFTIKTDTLALFSNIKVKGSKANKAFFEYAQFLNKKQKKVKSIQQRLSAMSDGDSISFYKEKLLSINKEVEVFRDDFLEKNHGNFAGIFLKGTIDPDRPREDEIDKSDSLFMYKYFKSHYWDNIPLSDERMLRTPYFQKKLDYYLDKVVVQHPDSLINAIDNLIADAEGATDLYRHLIWSLTIKYENAKIMGFDAIFVHMADKYYKTGLADWLYGQVVTNIIDRSNELKPLLIGKKGPNLVLLDTNNHIHSLHALPNKYSIILFWSTDCGHCKREMPKLKEFYDNYKDIYDFEVFAVNTDTNYSAWKSYVVEHRLPWLNVSGYRSVIGNYHKLYDIYSTPTIYVLDEKKNIIAKKILTKQIEELFRFRKQKKK